MTVHSKTESLKCKVEEVKAKESEKDSLNDRLQEAQDDEDYYDEEEEK